MICNVCEKVVHTVWVVKGKDVCMHCYHPKDPLIDKYWMPGELHKREIRKRVIAPDGEVFVHRGRVYI